MPDVRVFVYGTLLTEEHNNYLLASSKLLGRDTVPGLEMHDLGRFPACVTASQPSAVVGEVWEVNPEVFQRLDWLEGYPDFYDRIPVKTKFGEAWVYVCEQARGKNLIKNGNWKNRNGK